MTYSDSVFPRKDEALGWLETGLSVRDYIAIQAMQAILTGAVALSASTLMPSHKDIADDAYRMADAMMEASRGA